MNYMLGLGGILVAGYTAYSQYVINGLRQDNRTLTQGLNTAIGVNRGFEASLELLNTNYSEGIAKLNALKQEKQKEIHYVTTIKEANGVNYNCIGAINDIYKRLHEVSVVGNSSATTTDKPDGTNRSDSGTK